MQRAGDEAAALRLLHTEGPLCMHSVLGFRAMWSPNQPKGTELQLRHPLQPQSKLVGWEEGGTETVQRWDRNCKNSNLFIESSLRPETLTQKQGTSLG